MARVYLPLLIGCLVLAAVNYSLQDIVGDTCKRVVNPNLPLDFCIKTLSSDPSSRTADLVGLGVIAIGHLKKSVSVANSYAAGLLKKKWDPYTTQCLEDCLELYSDSEDSLSEIEGEYKEKLYVDAKTHLSAIVDSASTCESQFKDQKPMTSQNLEAEQSADLALAIVNILPK